MAKRRFDPPLDKRYVSTADSHDVFTVNAFAIRNAAQPDEEFSNFATHDDFPDLVAEGNIWTAEATWKKEGKFFVANAVAKLKALAAGQSEDKAFDAGNKAEQRLREQLTGIKFRNGHPHRRVPDKIYMQRYCTLDDEQTPIEVWLVDGHLVRCFYKTDYTEGGHGYVYRWCPRTQIWVEKSIHPVERPYIVAHEYIELRLMRDQGLKYDRAHEICSEMEFDLRKAKTRAQFPGLTRRHLTKRQLSALATTEFFQYVRKNYQHGAVRRVRAWVSDLASKVVPA